MVVAGSAFGIVQQQREARTVARRQEARHSELGDDGIAHGEPCLAAADRAAVVGHGHQAKLALEIRNIEHDLRRAVAIDADGTREQRDRARADDRQTLAADARGAGRGIAALAERAAGGAAVEQPAVIVAQLDAEPALAEQELRGIGRAEARQL